MPGRPPPGRAGRVWLAGRVEVAHAGRRAPRPQAAAASTRATPARALSPSARGHDWDALAAEARHLERPRAGRRRPRRLRRAAAAVGEAHAELTWTTQAGVTYPATAATRLPPTPALGGDAGPGSCAAGACRRALDAAVQHAAAAAALERVSAELCRHRAAPARHPRPLAARAPGRARRARPAPGRDRTRGDHPPALDPATPAGGLRGRPMSGYRRILVAVDDSPGGLDAARAAIELAAGSSGELRAVTVLQDHAARRRASAAGPATRPLASPAEPDRVLGWVAELAAARGVPCQTSDARRRTLPADPGGSRRLGRRSHRHGPLRPAGTVLALPRKRDGPRARVQRSDRCSSYLPPRATPLPEPLPSVGRSTT